MKDGRGREERKGENNPVKHNNNNTKIQKQDLVLQHFITREWLKILHANTDNMIHDLRGAGSTWQRP